ncbi:hypothetical protein CY34DRAFT_149022 [Suillus luteus UH-Slu-Lm8-n1]|uniref:Uncharacterized protein n=1 Tax=Suillus luteus UH-Slu-Lm8-n1 TaxID=930992 RepID=A0A0D0B1R5_9AGAM|nr:hypothetical protein CY34DRAFT_149022 [Suillus luteus UH-Slu-Lm8-n1]
MVLSPKQVCFSQESISGLIGAPHCQGCSQNFIPADPTCDMRKEHERFNCIAEYCRYLRQRRQWSCKVICLGTKPTVLRVSYSVISSSCGVTGWSH